MDITGLEDFFPSSEVEVFDHGRYEESSQPLIDLGFLRQSPVEGEIATAEDFKEAIIKWRQDVLDLGLLDKDDLSSGGNNFSRPEEVLSSQELKLLHELTGLDGSFGIKNDIHIGQQDLVSRVIIYRLDILDLVDMPADLPINQQVMDAISQLERWFDFANRSMVLNLIGNTAALVSLVRFLPAFHGRITFFKFSAKDTVKRQFSILGKDIIKDNFKKYLKETLPTESFRNLNSTLLRREPDYGFLEEESNKDINCFLLRLIQINQWIHGYYLGKLDSDIGPWTFSSILEITKSEVEAGNIDFRHEDFMAYVGNDYWLLNIHYFFQKSIIFEERKQPTLDQVMNRTGEMVSELNVEQRQNVEQNLRSAWRDINKEASRNLKDQKGVFRKIYLGIKSTIKSIWRTIKDIFEKLKEKARQITNQIKYLAKLLYHEIREGLRQYVKGMQFLFGKRIVETGSIVSKFDFDADVINFIKEKPTPDGLKQHMETVKEYAESLYFSLTLTGKVVHFIISVITISWPLLLVRIGIIFKNFLKDLLERKASRTTLVSIKIGY